MDTYDQLLAEYQANVELWQHDDMLRQQRIAIFLNVNVALLIGLGLAAGIDESDRLIAVVMGGFSVFGLGLAAMWRVILFRNSEYIRFRRLQLCAIESHLEAVTTFANSVQAMSGCPVVFDLEGRKETFQLARPGTRRSTAVENGLPYLSAAVWVAVGVIASVVAFV